MKNKEPNDSQTIATKMAHIFKKAGPNLSDQSLGIV